jgi:pilus assembly protein Flp/PilA
MSIGDPGSVSAMGPASEGSGVERGEPLNMTDRMYRKVVSLRFDDEEGQGLAEYALILALIAIVAIIALIFLGGNIQTLLSTVGKSV